LNYWIIAACCLHNFTIDIPFAGIDEQQFENEDEEMEENEDDPNQVGAQLKRNRITAYLTRLADFDSD